MRAASGGRARHARPARIHCASSSSAAPRRSATGSPTSTRCRVDFRLTWNAVIRRSVLKVSNYGQGYFFSSQELLQFINLLKEGRAPDWAIFVDGANDTYQMSAQRDVPYFSDAMRSL